MTYKFYNPNPLGKNVGDCVIRALTKALEMPWESVYTELCVQGFNMADMPSSNAVWGAYLRSKGFSRSVIPNTCPDCYTAADFAEEHPNGAYVLGTGRHAVAVVDGVIYDSWNSSNEIPIFYYERNKV